MLFSSLDALLKLSKTTSPQKLFDYNYVTLYIFPGTITNCFLAAKFIFKFDVQLNKSSAYAYGTGTSCKEHFPDPFHISRQGPKPEGRSAVQHNRRSWCIIMSIRLPLLCSESIYICLPLEIYGYM